MKTFWIGFMAATFVLETPMVGVIYLLGKIGLSYLESPSYISLRMYLKSIALAFGSAFIIAFFW